MRNNLCSTSNWQAQALSSTRNGTSCRMLAVLLHDGNVLSLFKQVMEYVDDLGHGVSVHGQNPKNAELRPTLCAVLGIVSCCSLFPSKRHRIMGSKNSAEHLEENPQQWPFTLNVCPFGPPAASCRCLPVVGWPDLQKWPFRFSTGSLFPPGRTVVAPPAPHFPGPGRGFDGNSDHSVANEPIFRKKNRMGQNDKTNLFGTRNTLAKKILVPIIIPGTWRVCDCLKLIQSDRVLSSNFGKAGLELMFK